MAIDGKQLKNSTITQSKLNLSAPSAASDATRKDYVDNQIATINTNIATQLDAISKNIDFKQSVRAATTANITLTGTQTVDGVALLVGNDVLVKDQTLAKDNGIYTVAAGSWTRRTDSDTSAKITAGMVVIATEGTANADTAFVLTTDDVITLGTTALTFTVFNLSKTPVPVFLNRKMACLVTLSDGDPASSTPIQKTPALKSAVSVLVNGIFVSVGDGVKTSECYFSADAGVTAKLMQNVVSGDKVYWNGSIAGYQLAANDILDLAYSA